MCFGLGMQNASRLRLGPKDGTILEPGLKMIYSFSGNPQKLKKLFNWHRFDEGHQNKSLYE